VASHENPTSVDVAGVVVPYRLSLALLAVLLPGATRVDADGACLPASQAALWWMTLPMP